MQGYNCIVVYNRERTAILFCKRIKEPYLGKFNLVGGKIEEGEEGFSAAYRELEEETGITGLEITLSHMMDFTYYNQDLYLEIYTGVLSGEVLLRQELHPLHWLPVTENFFALDKFAGEGNIGHMIEQVQCYGMGIKIECGRRV